MATEAIPQIIRSYKFKLLPTKAQRARLEEICESQRVLYNAALEERIDCYRKTGKLISYFDQSKSLTLCRANDEDMRAIPARIQRATLERLDEAFSGFFRRLKIGIGKAGFPRFKGKSWWSSFSFSEFISISLIRNRLRFKGMHGAIRVHMHRHIPVGDLLCCSFKRISKYWYVSIQVRHAARPLASTGQQVGIDVGLSSLATLSTGEEIHNLRHTRRAAKVLRRRQRSLSRCKKASNRRRKARGYVTLVHAKITNARNTYLHQVAARLVRENDLIAMEDLNVKGLASGMLAKAVNDAAWGKFRQFFARQG